MILANPSKGVLLRWRELLKSVAQQYPAQDCRTAQAR